LQKKFGAVTPASAVANLINAGELKNRRKNPEEKHIDLLAK